MSVPAELTSQPAARRQRFALRVGFGVVAAAVLAYEAVTPAIKHGDGWEYAYMLESLYRHGTPELRDADLAAANARFNAPLVENAISRRLQTDDGTFAQLAKRSWENPPAEAQAFHQAKDGRRFGLHFWAYSLSAVPALAVLDMTGGNTLAAMKVTNAAWLLLAFGGVLFGYPGSWWKRLAFLGLVGATPALWYVQWTGAELYTLAFAILAVVALANGRCGRAAAAAGLGAMQNPPLVFLAGACVLLALWRRDWRQAAFAVAGTGLAFIPAAFCYYHYGKPSLVAETATSISKVSWVRTWSLGTDLNQGLLPYLPLLMIAASIGTVALLARRSALAGALLIALAGMCFSVQLQVNWNSGCIGLMRYLLWMIPLLAWFAVEGLWGALAGRAWLALAVLTQAALTAYGPPKLPSYVYHSPVARFVMDRAPWLYYPPPEIFVERLLHHELLDMEWNDADRLPIGYVREDGVVTKIWVNPNPTSVAMLAERFEVDPDYLAEVRKQAEGKTEPFFIHPPEGKVRWRGQRDPEPPWWSDPPPENRANP